MIARKALTRGCAYYFVFGFMHLQFPIQFFCSTLPELVFPISLLFPAEKRIKEYCHPLTSNFDLWPWPTNMIYTVSQKRVPP